MDSIHASKAPARFRIAVMGAGAVGAFYGGMLARAGHEVVLIGRPAHVAAIRQQGLHFQAQSFDEHLAVAASTEPSAATGADVVLFCVKSTDTETAAAALRPHLAPQAVVLSLQNGIDNPPRLRASLPGHSVLGTAVYVAVGMAGPGHLQHFGRGELVIEDSPASAEIARQFAEAGIPTEVSGQLAGTLWAKLIVNCAYNALSAITQQPYGPLAASPGVPALLHDVVEECLAVARAEGVSVPGDPHEAVRGIARTMPGQLSSTARDLAAGKPTEIDHLNGLIVRRGEALGVPTPANRVLQVLVQLMQQPPAAAALPPAA